MTRNKPLLNRTPLRGRPLPVGKPAKPAKPHKCRACRAPFSPTRPLQVCCGAACAAAVAKAARAKREAKDAAAERKADRAKREKLKRRRDWMAEAQAAINRYVRFRDAGKPCISCGAMPAQKFGGTMDCGHFLSRGSHPHLKFHLWNMAAQCVRDNRFRGGNAGGFRKGLIDRIGLEKVECLESTLKTATHDIAYLRRVKSVFSKKANRAKARTEDQMRAKASA